MAPERLATDALYPENGSAQAADGARGAGGESAFDAVHQAASELGVHDHICLVYETQAELFASTVAYMQEGLLRGERCIYAATDTTVEEATDALAGAGVDVEAAVHTGDLAVVTEQETYLKRGHFDPDWMIGFLHDHTEEAEELGYEALRITGGVTWALGDRAGTDGLLEYEAKVNDFFETHKASGLCQYDRSRFSPEVIMGVLHTHPRVIYKDIVCRNFYYVPPKELLGRNQGQQRVERLLGNILARERVEDELRRLNENLERRVADRTADLEQANQELESFAYTVSHDLRAPLRGISTLSQIVDEDYADALDVQGREYLGRLQAESQRMTRLVDDLLRMSQVSTVELHREPVNLSEMASTILARLHHGAPHRKARVTIDDGLTARADPQLVRVVMENLLGNAWKYTGNEPVARIAFGAAPVENGGDAWALPDDAHSAAGGEEGAFFVRDNGVGFDPGLADRLFQPFRRLHTVNDFPGSGVGLATVKRVVERHDGHVWAQSAGAGEGATFWFTLTG